MCVCQILIFSKTLTQLKIKLIETSTVIAASIRKEFTMNCRFASFNNNRQLNTDAMTHESEYNSKGHLFIYKQKQQRKKQQQHR